MKNIQKNRTRLTKADRSFIDAIIKDRTYNQYPSDAYVKKFHNIGLAKYVSKIISILILKPTDISETTENSATLFYYNDHNSISFEIFVLAPNSIIFYEPNGEGRFVDLDELNSLIAKFYKSNFESPRILY